MKSKDVEQRIVILGAGYFAEEVADLISSIAGYRVVGFVEVCSVTAAVNRSWACLSTGSVTWKLSATCAARSVRSAHPSAKHSFSRLVPTG